MKALVESVLASSRALVAVSARSIAGAKGITLPQYRMLVVLDTATSPLCEPAAQLDVVPSTALRMVDRLDCGRAGGPQRESGQPPGDAVTPTASGRRTVHTVTTRRRRDLQAVGQLIPTADREAVARAMRIFAHAAKQAWPSTGTPGGS